jgi:hypothetical protein
MVREIGTEDLPYPRILFGSISVQSAMVGEPEEGGLTRRRLLVS